MNNVILSGRLTKDPDIRTTQGQSPKMVSRFTLAVDRKGKKEEGQQTADFISCVAFGRTAEFIRDYIKKGVKLNIRGRIQTGSYTNQEGKKIYTTDVVVEEAEFGESKASSGQSAQPQQAAQPAPAYQPTQQPMPQAQYQQPMQAQPMQMAQPAPQQFYQQAPPMQAQPMQAQMQYQQPAPANLQVDPNAPNFI